MGIPVSDIATTTAGGFEVPEPIINGPFDEPTAYWELREGAPPVKQAGRRPAGYWYRDPRANRDTAGSSRGVWREMRLVNLIRDRVAQWRKDGRPGISGTTLELFAWWDREGRQPLLFFAQCEAVETLIFLNEARQDYLTGIQIPRDEPSPERISEGFVAFRRLCAKMATGTGKSTVAAMIAAWSILNKVADKADARFSDTVLIVCPNVTIRSRLGELDPTQGEASLYRTRDLVPPTMMADLAKGRVIIVNWHVFEPQQPAGSAGARVNRAGVPQTRTEWIVIGSKMTTARGSRYFTPEAYGAAVAAGQIEVIREETGGDGLLRKAMIRSTRYVESDSALVRRVLGEAGGKQNVLVINDEAHHAYRIPPKIDDDQDELGLDEDEIEDEEADEKEATVWVEGLDRVNRICGINQCVDLSATPYYLGRMGDATNTVFPWAVSDFSLTDAIESGLTKVPTLVARGPTGQVLEAYFNIGGWILPKLTAAERGTKRGSPKPEAILKWAHTPVRILAGMWAEKLDEWAKEDDLRPPVFILVAKNKRIAKALYDGIAEDDKPSAIPSAMIPGLRNSANRTVTIRVDTSVVQETDSGNAKADETLWMRLTLDTVGRRSWPTDRQGRQIYPEGFEQLSNKLGRPLHPPGRDVRCIVSVGMLTEGWDCNTVTHVVGLRPFQSQLLCEQVVGRALRRRSYEIGDDGMFGEEPAYIFGVPFEVVPFKAVSGTPKPRPPQRRIHAVPAKDRFAITVPRVKGYSQGISNKVSIPDWAGVPRTTLDPKIIPPEAQMAAALNAGRPSIHAPGGVHDATLREFHARHREQELVFQMARDMTRLYVEQPTCEAPAHVLFPQMINIIRRYLADKVDPEPPAQRIDAFLSPYYGWIVERLVGAIRPDTASGEAPEIPDIEHDRACASAEIEVWTGKEFERH
jgi:type III restriction enzyme